MSNKLGLIVGGVAGIILLLMFTVEIVANYRFEQSPNAGQDLVLYETLAGDKLEKSVSDVSTQTLNTRDYKAEELTANDEVDTPNADVSISPTSLAASLQTMMVAGGCFWCVEADMEKAPGVVAVVSGYAGGTLPDPTYNTYDEGGHREVVQVIYDANRTSYRELLYHFIKHIDPTDPEGSFVDRGVEYSPAIYYTNSTEQILAQTVLDEISALQVYDRPLTVPVLLEATFYPAEDYHQDFYKKSVVRYRTYRAGSGRDAFIEKYWGKSASEIL
jgi:methionine-S-sulfoxide reductase